MEQNYKNTIITNISSLQNDWKTLKDLWEKEKLSNNPLKDDLSDDIIKAEKIFTKQTIYFLNCSQEDAEILYENARSIRKNNTDNKINALAAIHVSNVCRSNCLCCPMRIDNLKPENIRRATVSEIVSSAEKAKSFGFTKLFIQSGEDPLIVPIVVEALKIILKKYSNFEITLGLGSLNEKEYKLLYEAGAKKYIIKHETASKNLHSKLRQSPIEKRIRHMLLARKVGFKIGTGNILGLPGQTDKDLADDIIFAGRSNISSILSCTPYTPSDVLPKPYKNQRSGCFEKTKRFVALLRILFPVANIHAPSNADSPKIEKIKSNMSGQSELIMAGANEISVEFTSEEISNNYGLYDLGVKRYKVNIEKAKKIEKETGMELNLIKNLPE
jgi:biotin synthase